MLGLLKCFLHMQVIIGKWQSPTLVKGGPSYLGFTVIAHVSTADACRNIPECGKYGILIVGYYRFYLIFLIILN